MAFLQNLLSNPEFKKIMDNLDPSTFETVKKSLPVEYQNISLNQFKQAIAGRGRQPKVNPPDHKKNNRRRPRKNK